VPNGHHRPAEHDRQQHITPSGCHCSISTASPQFFMPSKHVQRTRHGGCFYLPHAEGPANCPHLPICQCDVLLPVGGWPPWQACVVQVSLQVNTDDHCWTMPGWAYQGLLSSDQPGGPGLATSPAASSIDPALLLLPSMTLWIWADI
jgi:hypothetical protein